jgi:hypothetical protein
VEGSGLSAAQFASEIGVSAMALSWLKWQLGRGEVKKPAKGRRASATGLSPMTFVEMTSPARGNALEVVLP